MNIEEIIKESNRLNGYGQPPSEFGEEFDALVYKTFSSTMGKELLYFMEKNMLMKPIWTPNQSEKLAYFLEGRNNLIRLFRERIEVFATTGK